MLLLYRSVPTPVVAQLAADGSVELGPQDNLVIVRHRARPSAVLL